jgi:tRNA pseudouridine synthase 10
MDKFKKPEILRIARRVLKAGKVCSNCLGRQAAHVSTGMTNNERGEILFKLVKGKASPSCSVCNNLFNKLEKFAKEAEKKLAKVEYSSFIAANTLSSALIRREEELWESVGIKYCEPIKSEINREFGKILERKLKKKVDEKKPDVIILLNLEKGAVEINISPLFIYGGYKKLAKIPQTKWESYPVTVEDIIGKVVMKHTGGDGHSLHAAGREDIDARCLDWRPFVFQADSPKKRRVSLKKIENEINKSSKIKVSALRFSDKKEVVRVKEIRPDKTYRVTVLFAKNPKEEEMKKLKKVGEIKQKTPTRVLHRRADKLRKRRVRELKWKKISGRKYEFEVRGEAGLYVKEFVTGDNGRTEPSVSAIAGKAEVKALDVIKIHIKGFKA